MNNCMRQTRRVPSLQDALGIPRTVGLDLSADRIDMDQPLPALLVAEVDSLAVPELALETDETRYLCLSSDNRHALSQPCGVFSFSGWLLPRNIVCHMTQCHRQHWEAGAVGGSPCP